MLDLIKHIDRELFLIINGHYSKTFDFLMSHVSGKFTWIPVYLFLLISVYQKFRLKKTLIVVGLVITLIFICDRTSVVLFKDVVQRYRPCHNLEIKNAIHLVNNYCGGQFGFVSSHAANMFGLATFFSLLFCKKIDWKFYLFMIWATLIGYSRIYLGVHYPLDVIGGAALGTLTGGIIGKIGLNVLKRSGNLFD